MGVVYDLGVPLAEFGPTVPASATLEAHVAEFMEAVQQGAGCPMREFRPQNLAKTMWAFTTLTAHEVEFLAAMRHGTFAT